MSSVLSAYDINPGDANTASPIFEWRDYFPQYDTTTNEVIKKSGGVAKAKIDGVVKFMDWLNAKSPDLYKAVMQGRPDLAVPEFAMSGLGGLSDPAAPADAAPSTSWGSQLLDFLKPLVGVYQQNELLKLNIKRAENGLDPVDSSAVSPTVNINASPEIKRAGMMGGLALVGVVALVLMRNKR